MAHASEENVSREMTDAERRWLEQFGHLILLDRPPVPDTMPLA